MKKLLCLLTAMLMLVCFAAQAEDESVWTFDTYSFSLQGYTGAESNLVIPEMIQGCTVDIIGLNAFNGASGIASMQLPATVRQIENGAISICDELASVTLNDGLLIIGDNCFSGDLALEEIAFPASLCYIGNYAFSECESLKKVVFNGECPVFAGKAFDWLPEDAVFEVPDDQYHDYLAAFENMGRHPNLQASGRNAEIPASGVAEEQFTFDAATGTITGYEGCDVRVDVPAEIGGVAVKAIGDEAFMNRNYMCYLTLPEGVESIGASAFEGCTRLLHVDFPETLKTIGSRAFADSYQGWNLNLPDGVETIGDEAFVFAAKLSGALRLPQGLKTVGSRAFAETCWLEEVYIPESVETIADSAFGGSGINYVVFEGLELPEMAQNAFADCTNLADIDLHTKATKQQMLDLQGQMEAFGIDCRVWRMQNPDVEYIGDGLDTYENGVMTGYTGAQTHIRPWDNFDDFTVTAVGDGAFRGNTVIEFFCVPYSDEFTTIGAEAFADSTLAKIDLFDSVTTINGGAFRNCANLTELTLPESVEFVGAESLYGCANLQKLTVLCDPTVLPEDLFDVWPENLEIFAGENATDDQLKYLTRISGRPFWQTVTRVGEPLPQLVEMPCEPLSAEEFWFDGEFNRLDDYQGYELNLFLPRNADSIPLTMIGGAMMSRASYGDNFEAELPVVSVVIPETYTEIPAYAFANCESLETVVCYAPIEKLDDFTFQNCTSLREVIFVNGVRTIGEYVFDNCPELQTVYLGRHVEEISEFAFLDQFGEPLWSIESCITDPALMPDVEMILESVKREPMAQPEPTPAPVAVPVGEEGAAFFGLWNGVEMVMGGDAVSLSEWDMVMTMMLCEDGRMIVSDGETIDLSLVGDGDWTPWHVEDGAAIDDHSVMTIMEDGRLCADEDGMQIIFEYVGPTGISSVPGASASNASASNASAGSEQRFGVKYVCENADVGDYPMDASQLGGEYSVIFNEDGSAVFVIVGGEMPNIKWKPLDNGNFEVDFYNNPIEIVWTETGFDMNYMDSMLMHFVPET